MNRAAGYSIFPAISGGIAGIYVYMASCMSGDRQFSPAQVNALHFVITVILTSVLVTAAWMVMSMVFARTFKKDIISELAGQSVIFGIPSVAILALPLFFRLNAGLSAVDLKVLGWVYLPQGGFTHFSAAGYFILTTTGLMLMLMCYPIMIRFIKSLHDIAENTALEKKILRIFLAVFAFTAVTTSYVTIVYPPTGDEPHYLTIAKSIGDDLDVDLTNQYITDKSYRSFYPVELEYENLHNSKGRDGRGLYSTHNAGVSFLMSPFLKLGGRLGVQLLMNFLTALLAVMLFLLLREIKVMERVAVLTPLLFAITSPVLMCSSLALTEIPSAILVLYCSAYLYAIFDKGSQFYDIELGGVKIRYASVIYFASLAGMTWLHSKLAVLTVIFYAAYYAVTWRKKAYKPAMEVINNIAAAVLGGLFIYYYYAVFGVFALTGIKHIHENASYYFIFDAMNAIKSFFAMLFDRNYGLFTYNPLFIISLWGAMLAWQKRDHKLLMMFLFTLPYYCLFLFWSDWTGSMIPARQMVPMAMVWAVFYAYFIDRTGFQSTKAFMAMLSVTLLSSFTMMVVPALRYSVSKEKIYAALGRLDSILLWIFPSFAKNPPIMDAGAVLYFIIIILAFFAVTKGKTNTN